MKRQPMEGFVEVGQGPDGKQGFWLEPSLVRDPRTNRVGLNLGSRSAVYVDDNGVNVRVGDGLEVTHGSPVAVRAKPTPIAQEINVIRAKMARQQEAINGKASQSSLDDLSSTVNTKAANTSATTSALGLVKQAAACADTSGTVSTVSTGALVLLSDVITSLTSVRVQLNAEIAQRAQLQADVNTLKAALRSAGLLGT